MVGKHTIRQIVTLVLVITKERNERVLTCVFPEAVCESVFSMHAQYTNNAI